MWIVTEFSPRITKEDSIYKLQQNWKKNVFFYLFLFDSTLHVQGSTFPKFPPPFQHKWGAGGEEREQIKTSLPPQAHASSGAYCSLPGTSLYSLAQLSLSNIFQLFCPSIYLYIKHGLKTDYISKTCISFGRRCLWIAEVYLFFIFHICICLFFKILLCRLIFILPTPCFVLISSR